MNDTRTHPTCAGCGSGVLRFFLEAFDAQGRPHAVVRCRVCRLAQVPELPTPSELAAFYSRYSYDDERAWESTPATERSLDRLAHRLERYRRNGRLLDVACGSGILMRAMRRHGWTAEGTELSDAAVDRLRREGLTLHRGALEDLELERDAYDVLVLSETIEHLRDPRAMLGFVARALRPGGALYLTTPNIDSLSRRLLGARWRVLSFPDHLFYFNPRSIRVLLRGAGLSPVAVWTEAINPYALLPVGRAEGPGGEDQAESRGECLRRVTVTSPTYSLLKVVANGLLRSLHLGDTLKALAEKRPPP